MWRVLTVVFLLFMLSAFNWALVDVEPAYSALQAACKVGKASCVELNKATTANEERAYFANNYNIVPIDEEGLLTGYYLPLIEGSYEKTDKYVYPVYPVPDDFAKPYLTRRQIDEGALEKHTQPILWVKDKLDLFFLHIQGSGRVVLPNGKIIGLGFAAKNGQPYKSIGKLLIEEGQIAKEDMSMQSLKAWLRTNPEQVNRILWQNPSYIFFKIQKNMQAIGAQGVPLTARGSIAVDPTYIPYGTPVLIESIMPNETEPRLLLVIAQDTGSAIKGKARADWFLGYGRKAEDLAGVLKQPAKFSILEPKNGRVYE